MLPELLASSYWRYKQDTATFTTWLAHAAALSGYKPKATRCPQPGLREQPGSAKVGTATAKVENVKPGSSTQGRLKGNERKAAKEAADKAKQENTTSSGSQAPSTVKYTVTTAELLRQAEAVAKSPREPRIRLPANLRGIVERAIRARQRCSEWFQKSEVRNPYADKRHDHFIQILRQCLHLLEPNEETKDTTVKHRKQDESESQGKAVFENRFSLLDIDESPEFDPVEDSEVAAAVNEAAKTKTVKGDPEITVYELAGEDEFDEELAFITFCFFEDLHRIQKYVNELWQKYKAGMCDLHTAALTTNAAFDLVRQAEQDLITQAPKVFDTKRSYGSIAMIVYYADAFQKVVCPEARLESDESLRITPFDDFIFLSTARTLMKFTFIADLPANFRLNYPLPCLPLRVSYIPQADLLGTPEMNRIEHEDLVLSKYIIDRQLWNIFKDLGSKMPRPPPSDEFGHSLDRLMKEGVLSVSLVFEARIFLDIQAIMGDDVARGYRDLVRTTNEIDKIMNLKPIDGAWDVGGTGERWHERDMDVATRIKQTSIHWILNGPCNILPTLKEQIVALLEIKPAWSIAEPLTFARSQQRAGIPEGSGAQPSRTLSKAMPPVNPNFSKASMKRLRVPNDSDPNSPEARRMVSKMLVKEDLLPGYEPVDPVDSEYEETARRLNIKPIQPSKDPNYLFTANPIWCGVISFSILTDFEAAGISLCNWHKSIWPTAHLYNALQQTSCISKSWPEMDELIDLHVGTLFAGRIPLSTNEFFKRFAHALGLSISSFSRRSIKRNSKDRIRSRRGANGIKLEATEISSVLVQFFENKTSLETCLVRLDNVIRNPGPRTSGEELEGWKHPLTNLQFLAMLEAKLPQVTKRLHFDYITLTKQCAKLLKDIRQQIALQHPVVYPTIPTEDCADQTLTWVVMQVLEENNDLASVRENAQTLTPLPVIGTQLKVAGTEVQKFLSINELQDLISNFNALPCPATALSGLVPNHWNVSVRRVTLSPPQDLVFIVQPNSEYWHIEGPIQTVEGHLLGHVLNLKSSITLETIARLIMKAFVEGMGRPSDSSAYAPFSWATNDPDFSRRIIKVMTKMGIRAELLSMAVADWDELATCDEAWERFTKTSVMRWKLEAESRSQKLGGASR